MSTATQGIDAKGYLIGWLGALTGMMIADIGAIPDDRWCGTHGGCSRPGPALIADTVSMLDWVTAALKGEQIQPFGDMESITAKFSDKGAAIASLTDCTTAFSAAFTSASDETLNTAIPAPWGATVPLFMLGQIAVNHIWYHDGQLNYVQCLLGDDQIHWMAPPQ